MSFLTVKYRFMGNSMAIPKYSVKHISATIEPQRDAVSKYVLPSKAYMTIEVIKILTPLLTKKRLRSSATIKIAPFSPSGLSSKKLR